MSGSIESALGPIRGAGADVEELRRNRELYRVVVENSRDPIALVDAAGTITFASPAWRDVLGYEPAEVATVALLGLIHPDDHEVAGAAIARTLDQGTAFVPELRFRSAEGRWRVLEGAATALLDEHGVRATILATFRDITERREAERRVGTRTEVARALAQGGRVEEVATRVMRAVCQRLDWDVGAMWTVDRSAGVLRCIDVWVAPSVEAPEFERATRERVFPPGRGLPGRVWENAEPAWIEDVSEDNNFPRSSVAVPEKIRSGFALPILLGTQVVGVLEFFSTERREPDEGLLQDISVIGGQVGQFLERKRAEEELLFQKTLLEAQSEAAIDGILMVDTKGRMVSFNGRFVEMWGIPDEVVASRSDQAGLESVRDKVVDPDEFLARVQYLYEHPEEESREEIHLKDGRVFDRYSAPVLSPEGVSYGRVWFFRDITDRKRSENALRFLANVSEMLGWSLDYRQTLQRLAKLSVQYLADWCLIYLASDDGSIERVAVEHVDPHLRDLADQLRTSHRIDPKARHGVPEVIRTGEPQLHPWASAELLAKDVVDPERQAAATSEIGVRSWICVPLTARGRTFGAMSFITTGSGRRYAPEDLTLAQDLARRAGLVLDNVRMYQERDRVSRSLQQSLLPPTLPSIPGADVAARYLPAGEGAEVGGDFYDVFEVVDGAWALAIGDVCGKGPEAAAVMALARYTVRAAAMAEQSPSLLLTVLNRAVMQQVTDGRFCTVCFGRMQRDAEGVRVALASGGHPLPLVLRAGGKVDAVGHPGTLLGVFADPELADRFVTLHPGDSLVMYTDGVIERRSGAGVFGEPRLRQVLAGGTGLDAEALADRIQQAVLEFGSGPPRDDLAILVVRIPPAHLADASSGPTGGG